MTSPASELGRIVVLIPAWRPDRALISIVHELTSRGFTRIVIVNDGSEPAFDPIFAALSSIELLSHPANRGKGAALKTGFEHILSTSPDTIGIVTADADGQHLPDDILRVARTLAANPDSLILGSRAFTGHVPLRSRFGNTVTRRLMRIFGGLALEDTQTGLRGVPAGFAARLPALAPNGYEFELEMLMAARQDGLEIHEEPIQTVYEPGNSSSHFNPLRDSVRICYVLLRLAFILLGAGAIDFYSFRFAVRHGVSILAAQILSRALAAVFTLLTPLYRAAPAWKRYLTVTVLLGAVSFAAIELTVDTHFLPVRRAKLWVEVFLFFVNLALQRDWVFRRSKPAVSAALFSWKTLPLWLLVAVPFAVETTGYRAADLGSVGLWLGDGFDRFGAFIICWLVSAAIFGVFFRRWLIPAVVLIVVTCSIYAVGFVPVATVLLFIFSVTVLGRLLFGKDLSGPLAMLAGIAIWIALFDLVARLPIHYAAVYLAALALPLCIGFRHTRRLAAEWLSLLRPRDLQPLEFLSIGLAAFSLTAIWLIVLAPEVSADGLAMHLAIPADIALHHALTADFHHFAWALMPMGADFCYAAVYLPGGEYAARLLNFAMLAGTALLIFQAARSFVSLATAELLAALFLSTPIAWLVTGSLFVENFVAFMTLGAVVALWQFHDTRSSRALLLAALLLGCSISLKIGALAIGLPGILILVFLGRRRPALTFAGVALALTLGAFPYAHAWRDTGNPFFPFANGIFTSQLGSISDQTYREPLSWHTPWDLTFHTNLYFEGQRGSFGFQYFLFLPLLAAGAVAARTFRARTVILLGLAGAVIIVAILPNARYLYLTTPMLLVGTAASLVWIRTHSRRLFQSYIAVACAAALANIWFFPSADWYHREFYTAPLFSESGRASYLHDFAPVREVTAWINRTHPTEPVVMADSSDIAGLIPPVYTNNWHSYFFVQKVHGAAEPDDVFRIFRSYGIERMVIDRTKHPTGPVNPRRDPLGALIAACGQPEFSSGSIISLRIRSDCESLAYAARCPAADPLTPALALVDDLDSRVSLFGTWSRLNTFPHAWNGTVSYSDEPGARACLTIEGTGFDYIYTRAFNRGIAEIQIDSRRAAVVDLYSPTIEWQSKLSISGLAPARHEVAILVLNRKRPESAGSYVDVDALRVF